MEKTKRPANDKKTVRITVLFSPVEYGAIAKKAIASSLKPATVIRLMTLKSLGHIQLDLFGKY